MDDQLQKEWDGLVVQLMDLFYKTKSIDGMIDVHNKFTDLSFEENSKVKIDGKIKIESLTIYDKLLLETICEKIIGDTWEYRVEQTVGGELLVIPTHKKEHKKDWLEEIKEMVLVKENEDYKESYLSFISAKKALRIMEWCPWEEDYKCPVCGRYPSKEDIIWASELKPYMSFDCWNAATWDELYKCSECKSYFRMEGDNC